MAKKKVQVDPYAAFRTDKVSEELGADAFVKLNDLLDQFLESQDTEAEAEQALKKAKFAREELEQRRIPKFMEEVMGMTDFQRTDGSKVTLVTKVSASIGDRKAQAYAWLVKHGHGSLIKRMVMVPFNRDQQKEADALVVKLQTEEGYADACQDMKVQAPTLTAFVKAQLKEGEAIDMDLFGVHEFKKVKITEPKTN